LEIIHVNDGQTLAYATWYPDQTSQQGSPMVDNEQSLAGNIHRHADTGVDTGVPIPMLSGAGARARRASVIERCGNR